MENLNENLMTAQGLEELKAELNYLGNTKMPEIVERIRIARDFGDLSENAEYKAAKEEQSNTQNRIEELERIIKGAKIVEANNDGLVSVGNKVTVYDLEMEEETEYSVVGTAEVNIHENKISNISPLGVALLGKKEGDVVTVEAPNGSYQVKILKVE